jgi:hypothetical protein
MHSRLFASIGFFSWPGNDEHLSKIQFLFDHQFAFALVGAFCAMPSFFLFVSPIQRTGHARAEIGLCPPRLPLLKVISIF